MRYRIVKIIDEYQVIINAGTNQNLKVDDIFNVISNPIKITDINDETTLGELELTKASIKIVKVYDNMAICENSVNHVGGYIVNPGMYKINDKVMPYQDKIYDQPIHEKLNINVRDLSQSLSQQEMTIKVGDYVEKI